MNAGVKVDPSKRKRQGTAALQDASAVRQHRVRSPTGRGVRLSPAAFHFCGTNCPRATRYGVWACSDTGGVNRCAASRGRGVKRRKRPGQLVIRTVRQRKRCAPHGAWELTTPLTSTCRCSACSSMTLCAKSPASLPYDDSEAVRRPTGCGSDSPCIETQPE